MCRAADNDLLDAATLDGITDRVASGEMSEEEAAGSLKTKIDAAKIAQMIHEGVRDGAALFKLVRASIQGVDVAEIAQMVADAAATVAHPSGEKSLAGGRCRLQGLTGAPELNGQMARILKWNTDGRRRYTVQLDSSAKMLSCQMRNVVAVDRESLAYPHDFDCTSAEFVQALQAELRAAGSTRIVLDWTPLVAAVSDVVHLLHAVHNLGCIHSLATMVHDVGTSGGAQTPSTDELAAASGVFIFVQSTPQTAPFFLAHREFFGPSATLHTNNDSLAALPWLLMMQRVTVVPTPWVRCCKKDYMVRVCLNLDKPEFTCPICHEERKVADNPTQLPCSHFLCTDCLKQLSPPTSVLDRLHKKQQAGGLSCPVCRAHFPNHSLSEHASAPGGVALFEVTQ